MNINLILLVGHQDATVFDMKYQCPKLGLKYDVLFVNDFFFQDQN